MHTVRIEFTVERDNVEFDLAIEGRVSPYVAARTHGPPEDCSPAEGGDVEVVAITRHGGPWTGELTQDEETLACEQLGEAYAEQDDDGPEWDEGRDDYDDIDF